MKDYKEKIRKLLALAESNNEYEARAALLKAKELMAEYKIEEIDLADVKDKHVKRIVTQFEYTKRGEWWIGSLAQIIAENYCCRSAGSRDAWGAQKRTVMFIGLEGDVDISVCSPFEIFPDNNTTENIDDLTSIIQAKPYHRSIAS